MPETDLRENSAIERAGSDGSFPIVLAVVTGVGLSVGLFGMAVWRPGWAPAGILTLGLALTAGFVLRMFVQRARARRMERIHRRLADEVAERQKRQEELLASERRFELLAEASPALVFRTDANGRGVYANERWGEMTGLPGKTWAQVGGWLEAQHPDDRERMQKNWREAVDEGKPFREEVRAFGPDGREFWVLAHAVPIRDAQGRVEGFIGTATDITELKRTDAELRESERRFRTLAEASPSIVFHSDARGGGLYANRRFHELTGWPQGTGLGQGWANAIHPDDRGRILESWQRLLGSTEGWREEFRFQRVDGSSLWVLGVAAPIQAEDGTVEGYIGTCTDITELKRTEDELRESEERFHTLAETSPSIVGYGDRFGRAAYFNKKLRELTGLSEGDLIGTGWYEVIHPDDRQAVIASFERAGALGEPWQQELRFRRADGDYSWFLGRAVPRRSHDREIQGYIGTAADITELKRTEHELRESEERFQNLAAASPSIVFFGNRDGEATYVNDRWHEVTGLPEGSWRGTGWATPLHPDDREEIIETWRRTVRLGEPWEQELRFRRADGTYSCFLARAVPQKSGDGQIEGYVGTATDISELKRTEHELRESETRFQTLAEASPSLVFLGDPDGNATYVNDRWQDLTGLPKGSWRGEGWATPLHPDDRSECLREWGRAMELGEPWQLEYRLRRADGGYSWFLGRGVPIPGPDGELEGFVGTATDITQIKEVEAKLSLAKEAAESASRAKNEFLANMSHEIRTPMTSILGFSSLLASDPQFHGMPEDWRTGLDTIERSGRHLLALIDDILDVSKIEAGRLDVELAPWSPVEILGEVSMLFRGRAEAKGLAFDVTYPDNLPRLIQTDRVRLRQVLTNLVSNAVKFTDAGSVVVRARAGRGAMVFEVTDTGIGMSSDEISKVLGPFVQADSSMTRRYGGTGLGLTISRSLCELLGGSFEIVSQPGVGTRATARIRTTAPDELIETGPDGDGRPVPPIPGKELEGRHVLVVEDSPDSQLLISLMLRGAGARVATADDGRAAVDRALSAMKAGDPFDAVLMDVQLPVMDGHTATRELRDRGFRAPIVAITAHAMSGDRARCLTAGCDDYLTKPVDRTDLVDALTRRISESELTT
jgi:PAS domain S-box-containing protein